MSEDSNKPSPIVIAAFGLALVGTALGFGSYNRIDEVALGLARVEMVGAAVTRKNLDAAHTRIVELETRIASLESQLAKAKDAPTDEE